jgi:hypothetical protein
VNKQSCAAYWAAPDYKKIKCGVWVVEGQEQTAQTDFNKKNNFMLCCAMLAALPGGLEYRKATLF